MKKLLVIVLAPLLIAASPPAVLEGDTQTFTGPIKVVGEIYKWTNGILSTAAMETTSDLTLYVETTGSDSNNCLSLSKPCLTVQSAIDRVPRHVRHNVTISVGAGSFPKFYMLGFVLTGMSGTTGNVVFKIQGTLGAPTLTTGTVSGTATGGTTGSCIDAGQNWTVNELRGKFALVNGEYRTIRDNTANTLYVVGTFAATCSGKIYNITEHKTLIGDGQDYPVRVSYNFGGNALQIAINDLKAVNSTSGAMYFGYNMAAVYATRVQAYGGAGSAYGINFQDNAANVRFEDVSAINTPTAGFSIVRQHYSGQFAGNNVYVYGGGVAGVSNSGIYAGGFATVAIKNAYIERSVGYGVYATYGVYIGFTTSLTIVGSGTLLYGVDVETVSTVNFDTLTISGATKSCLFLFSVDGWTDLDAATITNCGEYGISGGQDLSTQNTSSPSTLNATGTLSINNCTLGGVLVPAKSIMRFTTLTGVGNGGYGIDVRSGGYVLIKSTTTITGASGDATVNEGVTPLVWATDFAANGDKVMNLGNGSCIERKD